MGMFAAEFIASKLKPKIMTLFYILSLIIDIRPYVILAMHEVVFRQQQ